MFWTRRNPEKEPDPKEVAQRAIDETLPERPDPRGVEVVEIPTPFLFDEK